MGDDFISLFFLTEILFSERKEERMTPYKKLSSLLVGILAIAVILTACGGTTPAPVVQPTPLAEQSTPTVTADTGAKETEQPTPLPAAAAGAKNIVIFDWAGYDVPDFYQAFTAQHPDVKVEYTLFEQDADAFAKMQTGFQVDLVHPCSSWWGLYVEAGLVQPIDTSKLKNWPDVLPDMAKSGQFNGKQYFVPWEWGYDSIIARTDKVKKIPASWADLWEPEYAGHLSIPDAAENVQISTAVALGFDPWHTTPEQDEAIKQKLIALKPNILTYWTDSTELNQLLASGDVWVASGVWPETYASLSKDGIAVEYIQPKEGWLGWVCGYAISSQAKDVELAHAYLDALLDPPSIAHLGNDFWYGVSNKKAVGLIDPEVVKLLQLDQPEVLNKTIFYQTMTSDQREKVTKMWDEVKIAP